MGLSNYIPSSRISQSGVCTSTTRPASPYEGQIIYETDTNRVLVWDASAWVMIADTDQPPGLQLVKTDTITSGSAKEITGVFSSEFKHYKILVSNFESNVAFGLVVQMGTETGTLYYYGGAIASYGSGAISAEVGQGTTGWATGAVGNGTKGAATIELFSPHEAIQTSYACQGVDVRTGGAGLRSYTGFINNTTSYTSFRLSVGGNTFTSCDVAVYGYRN